MLRAWWVSLRQQTDRDRRRVLRGALVDSDFVEVFDVSQADPEALRVIMDGPGPHTALDRCVHGCDPSQCDHSSSGGRCDVCGGAK